MRSLTVEERMDAIITLAISKIVFLALLIKISFQAVKRLDRIQKYFLWKKSSLKTTQSIKT